MRVDPTIAKTHRVPINPDTGEAWGERLRDLSCLATRYRYEAERDEERVELKAEYDRLCDGVEFRSEPCIMQSSFICGALAAPAEWTPPKVFSCHPETWAALSEDLRSKFELKEQEKVVEYGQYQKSSVRATSQRRAVDDGK